MLRHVRHVGRRAHVRALVGFVVTPLVTVAFATAVAGAQVATPSGPFALMVLGSFGAGGNATLVNESGQVAGYNYALPDYTTSAFFWSHETGMVDIGKAEGTTSSVAMAMTDHGQVVGYSVDYTDPAYPAFHPYSWTSSGGRIELPTPGASQGLAADINDAGDVVGWIGSFNGPDQRAVMWRSAGGVVDLGLPGSSYALAVNDAGHVIGANPYGRAFFWTQSDGGVYLGSLGGGFTQVQGLNSHDQVVGQSVTSNGEWHAFSWTKGGGMVDLDTLGGSQSEAVDINDAGQIVGAAAIPDGSTHAFFWSQQTGMRDLDASLTEIYSFATGINENGAVIGGGYFTDGRARDFYWTEDVGMVELAGRPLELNDQGQIAGVAGSEPALWSPLPYEFDGFFPPVDNGGVLNVVSAGRSIPVKFDLDGDRGMSIFAVGYPRSTAVQCSSGVPQDLIEQTVAGERSQLNYAPVGHYHYIWKTDPAWAGQCRQLQVKLNDGQLFTANFRFTR